jgi:hypothetical protein
MLFIETQLANLQKVRKWRGKKGGKKWRENFFLFFFLRKMPKIGDFRCNLFIGHDLSNSWQEKVLSPGLGGRLE